MDTKKISEIEIDVLLDAIRRRYDYDFSKYARASLKRRIHGLLVKEKLDMPYQLIPRILYDESVFNRFLSEMSVTVTEMFRDHKFFEGLCNSVFPVLATYPYFKVWHAGCATGEEVYSVAIMLHEAGLLERAKIYATDYNNRSIDVAKKGIYPKSTLAENEKSYINLGGKEVFSNYYTEQYDAFKIKDKIKKSITFAYHNLVKDGIFGEMNLIICRNVFIYFDRDLQDQVLTLFDDSLGRKSFLCLGSRETLRFSVVSDTFETLSEPNSIYRKRG